jgi:hypothetical protein
MERHKFWIVYEFHTRGVQGPQNNGKFRAVEYLLSSEDTNPKTGEVLVDSLIVLRHKLFIHGYLKLNMVETDHRIKERWVETAESDREALLADK